MGGSGRVLADEVEALVGKYEVRLTPATFGPCPTPDPNPSPSPDPRPTPSPTPNPSPSPHPKQVLYRGSPLVGLCHDAIHSRRPVTRTIAEPCREVPGAMPGAMPGGARAAAAAAPPGSGCSEVPGYG